MTSARLDGLEQDLHLIGERQVILELSITIYTAYFSLLVGIQYPVVPAVFFSNIRSRSDSLKYGNSLTLNHSWFTFPKGHFSGSEQVRLSS